MARHRHPRADGILMQISFGNGIKIPNQPDSYRVGNDVPPNMDGSLINFSTALHSARNDDAANYFFVKDLPRSVAKKFSASS